MHAHSTYALYNHIFVTGCIQHRLSILKVAYQVLFYKFTAMLHDALNEAINHRKGFFIPQYSLFRTLIWAFPSYRKAYSIAYKIVFMLI